MGNHRGEGREMKRSRPSTEPQISAPTPSTLNAELAQKIKNFGSHKFGFRPSTKQQTFFHTFTFLKRYQTIIESNHVGCCILSILVDCRVRWTLWLCVSNFRTLCIDVERRHFGRTRRRSNHDASSLVMSALHHSNVARFSLYICFIPSQLCLFDWSQRCGQCLCLFGVLQVPHFETSRPLCHHL